METADKRGSFDIDVDVDAQHARVQKPGVSLSPVVAIACIAQFMVVLDGTIMNVALTDIRRELHLSAGTQQWVITSYLITFGGLLLPAAKAGDLFGRRRVLNFGLVLFTLASLAGGLANGPVMLLIARAVQGIGAAALAPASLSLITASHPEQAGRARALSYWSAAAAGAGAAGMVLGGVLTDTLSWRWVLFVNVPVGVGLLVASYRWLNPKFVKRAGRLSLTDAVLITAAAAALVYGISQSNEAGWDSLQVIVSLAAAIALLGGFVLVTARSSKPLVPPSIYRNHNLRLGNLISTCLGAVMVSTIFILSVYEQQVLGYSPIRTGLSLVPWMVVLIIGTFAGRRLLVLFGPKRMLIAGAIVNAAGLIWMAWLPVAGDYAGHILGPTLIAGVGTSLCVLPNTVTATEGVRPSEAGLASGLLNMGRQIGGALGLAVIVTVATSVASRQTGVGEAAATVHGYHVGLFVAAGLSAAIALLALLQRGAKAEQ